MNIVLEQLLIDLPKHSVIDSSISQSDYVALDFSKNSKLLQAVDVSSSEKQEAFVNNHITLNKSKVAFGGYIETRSIYQRSSYFKDANPETERNIHLGLDLG